jgi:UDP-N-acetylglucosamine--N-acetylmuramyl-(pentapeptide) pyrophosphoryl-undecaprenol N-acetylglucosamine transferase
MSNSQPYRLILTGGGTGGHIYPAIAVANTVKERYPSAEVLFVGAIGKMEMTKVPEAGYKIVGLTISCIQRKLTFSNLLVPFKLVGSYFRARSIIKHFKPHILIGTGGYASGPMMLAGAQLKIPYLIQEQNSYAGLTNKQIAGNAKRICVAYPNMDRYFPKDKIVFTGNPVRKDIQDVDAKKFEALDYFGFSASRKTLLIIGGSLGAKTINASVLNGIDTLLGSEIQVIWQTGKIYYNDLKRQLEGRESKSILVFDFLQRMDLVYAVADVVISRAGALSISELCLAKKPSILVPSPNVAEDHQTKNALALVNKKAAILVKDNEASEKLIEEAVRLLYNEQYCHELQANIAAFGKPEAANEIVDEIEKIIHGIK